MKTIIVKYDVGDKIKYIRQHQQEIVKNCPCCAGEGQIVGRDGLIYDCGECEGSGVHKTGKYRVTTEECIGTISSVHVAYDTNMCRGRSKNLGNVYIYYNVPQSRYNIDQEDIIEKIVSE